MRLRRHSVLVRFNGLDEWRTIGARDRVDGRDEGEEVLVSVETIACRGDSIGKRVMERLVVWAKGEV